MQTSQPIASTALIAGAFVVSIMPAFLTGALGGFLRAELAFDAAGLGAAISAFFITYALTAVVGSRLAERLGGGRALAMAASGTAVVLFGIALFAESLAHLVLLLAAGGLFNGVAEPATNLALLRSVTLRQGLMFGVKQSAVPLVTLLAGSSVPLVALTLGWRWAFAGAALLAVVVATLMPSDLAPAIVRPTSRRLRAGDTTAGPLIAMAIGMGFGTAAAVALGSFLVESSVDAGIAVSTAGWLLAGCSVASIVVRLGVGWLADRRTGIALYVASLMLLIGSVGYWLMADGSVLPLMVGATLAYAAGWGWSGLLMYSIARLNQNAPAAASGIVLTGGAVGAAIGPFAFGHIVVTASFAASWRAAAAAAALSAALILGARFWLVSDHARRRSESS